MHCKDVKVVVLSQLRNYLLLNNVKQNYQPCEVSGKAGGKVQRNIGRHRKCIILNCYKKVNNDDSPKTERLVFFICLPVVYALVLTIVFNFIFVYLFWDKIDCYRLLYTL